MRRSEVGKPKNPVSRRPCGRPAGDPDASTPAQDSVCSQSVYVWKQGSTFFIGFTGEVAGVGGPLLTSSQTDMVRVDGISYFGLENLDLDLGSGDDGVNVRGTSAATGIDTGAGDDLVFVSDAANQVGLPSVSCWAAVPHYAGHTPSPKATLALLGRLEDLFDAPLEHGELDEDARAWERGIDELAASDSEVAEYVESLEEAQDTAELPEASGDAIAKEFERYLRRRGSDDTGAPGGP